MTPDRLDTLIRAHQHAAARRLAEADRQVAINDFWRGADAAWARIQQGASERLSRSTRRLQARLDRRAAA
ncbi:hypothetical protein [Hydrogenophaga sp. RWCD_12]|uniref:hypothetical protein n=1 Tax=Hydrogenophaga sp. RWCD_12 TaxID=3391190 RepID=UPI003984D55D